MTLAWRAAFVCAIAAISWLALSPPDRLPPIHFWDKLSHTIAFGALALLSAHGWPRVPTPILAAILLTYGATIEVLQIMVPGRHFSWLDLLADGVGLGAYFGVRTLGPPTPADR